MQSHFYKMRASQYARMVVGFVFVCAASLTLVACDDLANQAGSHPGSQVNEAKTRIKRAEKQEAKHVNDTANINDGDTAKPAEKAE